MFPCVSVEVKRLVFFLIYYGLETYPTPLPGIVQNSTINSFRCVGLYEIYSPFSFSLASVSTTMATIKSPVSEASLS